MNSAHWWVEPGLLEPNPIETAISVRWLQKLFKLIIATESQSMPKYFVLWPRVSNLMHSDISDI